MAMGTSKSTGTLTIVVGHRCPAEPFLRSWQRFVLLRCAGRCRLAAAYGPVAPAAGLAVRKEKKKALQP